MKKTADRLKTALCMFAGLTMILLWGHPKAILAHKPVTSKYTYHRDIQPLFASYCSGCHRSGGVAPMSLLSYQEAYPWAESIKEYLLSESMHPWQNDEGFGLAPVGPRLSARELDMIIDWASGSAPEGDPKATVFETPVDETWELGEPDMVVSMPESLTFEADEQEKIAHIVLPVPITGEKWLISADLRPGNPGIVHDAILYTVSEKTTDAALPELPAERILAVWLPGLTGGLINRQVAWRLTSEHRLALRIHYRKTWRDEGKICLDRSALGLYFHRDTPQETLNTLVLSSDAAQRREDAVFIEHTVERDLRVTAFTPVMSREDASMEMSILDPDGQIIDLLRIVRYNPGWPAKYTLADPLPVKRGSRLMLRVGASPVDADVKISVWVDYL